MIFRNVLTAGRFRPVGAARARPGPAGAVWLALAILAALPLFRFGLEGLLDAWARPEFSHGPVIPLLSFYMFLREMKAVPPPGAPVTDRWPGVAVIGLALGLAALGNLVQIDHLVFYALIVWVAGLVLTCFGFRRGLAFWPSVLHLVFMLPLPQFLYWKVTTTLQLVSSEIGVQVLMLAGVPVYLDGNVIDLGVTMLQVAEACSGLRYLFPIMSFSYVFAVLYRGPVWQKLVLLLLAVPVAVLMNAVRIGIIGLLVDRYGIAQAEGFLHVFEGWVVFLSCLGVLFLMVKAMQRLCGDRRPLGQALALDFGGLGAELGRIRRFPASRALVAAALVTAGLGLLWSLAPAREVPAPARAAFAAFPAAIAGWQGTPATLTPAIERILGADDYLSMFYAKPGAPEGVDLFLSWYRSQTDGNAIHSPEVCLPGAGWEVARIAPVTVALPGTALGRLTVNRAVIQKGLERQLVYYWFAGRGRQLTGDFAAKFATVADGLTRGRTDGGLVRVITPIGPDDGTAAADARLAAFLAASVDLLPRFIPD
jgi:exosortase D (VPLPA-CTERM-specific)